MPRLNHAREAHSSIVVGMHLFVIGGSGVGTIEGLNYVHGTAWDVLVDHCQLVNRYDAKVHQVGPSQIIVLGGYNN